MDRSCILLQKNKTFSRSFPFFAKECCVLCILFCSLGKNGKERNIHFKERKRTERTKWKRTRFPPLLKSPLKWLTNNSPAEKNVCPAFS